MAGQPHRSGDRRSFGAPSRGLLAWAALLSLPALWFLPSVAKAGDLEDFQNCRSLYEVREYARSVSCFEELVGEDVPRLTSTLLVLESRKLLAVSYVFVGRREAAAEQFGRLLRADPTYEIDAALFPIEVVEMFEHVRGEIQEEVRHAEERAEEEARHAREVARIRALIEFAEEEVQLESERSRWIAAIPFGVGQFDRGEDGLGAFFLTTESLFSIAAAITLGLNVYATDAARELSLTGAERPDDPRYAEVNRLLLGSAITNWISVGATAILMGAGILEAQLNFRPTRVMRHRRTIPPDLLEGLQISVSPVGVSLRASF
jgi:tetratricopeptide (TPR) repeat protein